MFPTLLIFLKSCFKQQQKQSRKKKSKETTKVILTFASSMSKTSHQGDLTPLIARSNEQVKNATWIKSEKKKGNTCRLLFSAIFQSTVEGAEHVSFRQNYSVSPWLSNKDFFCIIPKVGTGTVKKKPWGGINFSPVKLRNLFSVK